MINYHKKTFRSASATANGDVNAETIFIYRQDEEIITASYAGGDVISGHLIATVDEQGRLDMRYHHVNTKKELRTGKCISTPEVLANGKLLLHEQWEWTCGDMAKGQSTLEEI
jgi:hypothetical protein